MYSRMNLYGLLYSRMFIYICFFGKFTLHFDNSIHYIELFCKVDCKFNVKYIVHFTK